MAGKQPRRAAGGNICLLPLLWGYLPGKEGKADQGMLEGMPLGRSQVWGDEAGDPGGRAWEPSKDLGSYPQGSGALD